MQAMGSTTDVRAEPALEKSSLRVGVVVATLGRPGDCETLMDCLMMQTQRPSAIVLSTEKPSDLPTNLPSGGRVVMGPRGLCAQRNRGVAAIVEACDVIVFFDDDFLPSSRSIEGIAELFAAFPDVVGATGRVLADGVTRGGIGLAEAWRILADAEANVREPVRIERELKTAYGCNMAFRVSAMKGHEFDERLPLYGWQEDVDFAGQLTKVGRIVQTNAMIGVHRGAPGARAPGARLGFSQIVNPLYLVRKGTMRRIHAARLITTNMLANHARALAPEKHVDRAGRVRGNWRGLAQVLRGRIEPLDMLKID
jgi:hypothetical protein